MRQESEGREDDHCGCQRDIAEGEIPSRQGLEINPTFHRVAPDRGGDLKPLVGRKNVQLEPAKATRCGYSDAREIAPNPDGGDIPPRDREVPRGPIGFDPSVPYPNPRCGTEEADQRFRTHSAESDGS